MPSLVVAEGLWGTHNPSLGLSSAIPGSQAPRTLPHHKALQWGKF